MRPPRQWTADVRHEAVVALSLVLGLSLLSSRASAHDPPFGTGLFVHEDALLVRTNRGLVLVREPDRKPQLLCNEALGVNTAEVPAIVAVAGGRWLVGSSQGLSAATADLCALEPVAALSAVAVPAVVRDPHSSRIFASTGQADYGNAVFSSSDDGESFEVHSDRDAQRMFDRVLVSPSDEMRVYASGLRLLPDASGFTSLFAVSTDGAKTFAEHPFTLARDEYGIELLGVHPTDARTVFAVAHANLGTGVKDRFLVSHDAAESFETKASFDKLEAFVIDSSGSKLHVGARDGLWQSTDAGETFTHLQDVPVHCLTRSEDLLYVCDDQGGQTGISTSSDDGRSLQSVFRFVEVTTRVECAAGTTAEATCTVPWLDWQRELNAGFAGDAGMAGPDAPDAEVTAPTAADGGDETDKISGRSDQGCSASSSGSAPGAQAWWLVLCVLAWKRGRPRTTRRATIVGQERVP